MEIDTETPELLELDQRRADRMLVTLWWVKDSMHTYVEVVDLKTDPPTVTEIPVEAPATPHEVFTHPFKYVVE